MTTWERVLRNSLLEDMFALTMTEDYTLFLLKFLMLRRTIWFR